MDCFVGKRKSKSRSKSKRNQYEKQLRGLNGKVRVLEDEMKAMMCEREKESRGYERDEMIFAFKEDEWKQEKKKLKDEVKRLRKMLEDKNNSSVLVEQMREERIWRDEAVEKWKKLYLAIKTELDDLILRTHPGDGLYRKAEKEEVIEELKKEVKNKEKSIEELKERLGLLEKEEYKRAREVDILRQSLRIMTSKKVPNFPLTKPKFAFVKQAIKA
ncbi:uncharacterized protein [Euphorbia lathyris]|uniref:uncharacterized protein n=1 Tax=Euphorbia lathyris TaxID=212925 RepID=UPI0033140DAC